MVSLLVLHLEPLRADLEAIHLGDGHFRLRGVVVAHEPCRNQSSYLITSSDFRMKQTENLRTVCTNLRIYLGYLFCRATRETAVAQQRGSLLDGDGDEASSAWKSFFRLTRLSSCHIDMPDGHRCRCSITSYLFYSITLYPHATCLSRLTLHQKKLAGIVRVS